MAKVGPRKRRERQASLERIRQSQADRMRVRAIRDPLLVFCGVTACIMAVWVFG